MNLLELKSWLIDQTLTPQADGAGVNHINQAYLNLATAYDWSWLETTDSFDHVAEQANYPLPSDFNRLRAVIYSGQGPSAQPKRTNRDSVLARLGDDVGESSLPGEYYRQGSDLIFVPTPSGTQEVTLLYYKRPELLVNDEDEPLFDQAFHVYLAEAAAALYFESEDSFEHASYYNAKAADTFARMADYYDLQMPPEQPFVIGHPGFIHRPLPYVGWETSAGV